MSFSNYKFTVSERFLRYVRIDTQSDPTSKTTPSTEKQKNLSKLLVDELKAMGVKDAELDGFGYVYATIESNSAKAVPSLCFCAHVDTAPDCTGANVKPVVHKNYQGGDIVLPGDRAQVIRESEHPELKDQRGNDIITTDGTTLLGADDKAGVAEIMDAANYFMTHPKVKHGRIRLLFTPDEEVGRGADKADMKKLGADFGYTLDGGTIGSIENETFSADGVSVKIKGFSTHPGYAKDKMQHAVKLAAQVINRLPTDKTPETTEKKQPFIHPVSINGGLEEVELKFIVRAFDTGTLKKLEDELKAIVADVVKAYDKCSFEFTVSEQYRNMKEILDKHPEVVSYGVEAIKRSGLTPKLDSIRGGTDGSRFSFMGLPCANLFAGEHGIHSKQEWVSVQDMQKAVETIVNIASIWEEKASTGR
jgi:tripeptide aminopeptidase